MEYLLLIYDHDQADVERSQEERDAMVAQFGRFTQQIQDAGAYIGSDRLQPPHTATTVRGSDGRPIISDGPFAETREWLAGYYKIQAQSIDEATEWASQIPSIAWGRTVEVRPVMPVPADYPTSA